MSGQPTTADPSLLQLQDLVVHYRVRGRPPVQAVNGVNLDVGPGQVVGLVGESGCGKSTLARVAVGLEAPTSGQVRFRGQHVEPLGWRRRAGNDLGLQMVFQNPYSSLNPRRTVAAQLLDGAGSLPGSPAGSPAGSKPGARKQQVSRLLARVGLEEDAAGRYPHEFSGGQRQRIAIARALAAEPALIIADEPVTALDASSQAQVVKLLTGLVAELGMGMVFISHDLALVRAVADEIAVMYLGTIVERAPTDQLWGSPQHPYTRALIDAVPDIDADGGLPAVLSGEVPDPARPPAGCRFRPRCPHAMDKCWKDPPLFELGGRTAACWLADPDQAAMPPTAARE